MKKEEVLLRAQSRKENEMDEMELDILNKGYRTGFFNWTGHLSAHYGS